MNLIIWCILYILTRPSIHSKVISASSEDNTRTPTEIQLKKTYSTPLIFNQQTEQLNELSVDGVIKCRLCLIGCPVTSQPYKKFNEEVSISKNSVFVKNVVDEDNEYADEKNTVDSSDACGEPFRPSMVRDEKTKTYEIGYEFYYKEGEADLKSKTYTELTLVTSDIFNKKHIHHPIKQSDDFIPVKNEVGEATKFLFPDGTAWMFYWISVLSFKIKSHRYQIRIAFKNDSSSVYETTDQCDDYNLGNELYQSENDINLFFSEPNDMFGKIDVPPLLRKPEEQAIGLLERTQIMPMMFLNTKASKLATCSYMNTVPVWSSIVDRQLKLVDRYLYTIFKHWSPNVNILFGVSDVFNVKLQNPTTDQPKKPKISLPLPLSNIFSEPHDWKEIKIPKLIYRVVEFHIQRQGIDYVYYIVIVIHNHPSNTVTDKDRLCEVPTYGWEAIRNDDPEKGLSYACALSKAVNKKLGAFDKFDYPEGFHGTLQLSIMPPKIIQNTTMYDYTDQRDNINKMMKELFPDQEIPEI